MRISQNRDMGDSASWQLNSEDFNEADIGAGCGLDSCGWRVRYAGRGGGIWDRLADDWGGGVVLCGARRAVGWARLCAGGACEWNRRCGGEQSVGGAGGGG